MVKYGLNDIAIVIINWNGQDLLERFLPQVVDYSKGSKIYLADNASTDDSVEFVKERFPSIKIIQNQINNGYAKGYNVALKHVHEPIICLLNNDIEVTENWLVSINEEFNLDNNIAIIQPKILDYNKREYFEYAGAAGGFIDKYGYPYCRGRIFETIEQDKGQYNDNCEIFWASGACFFIKNDVFKSLNGFDESYFAHMEEIDLCWRSFNNGHIAKFVGDSCVYHVGGATLKNTNPKKTFLNFRNSLFTLVKNTDSRLLGRIFTRMFLDGLAAIRFLFQLKPLFFIAVLKAHFAFYLSLSRILKVRSISSKRPDYFKKNSIVWSYFIEKKKTF